MYKNIVLLIVLTLFVFSPLVAAEKINLELEYLEYKKDHMKFKENIIYKGDIKISSKSGEYYEDQKKMILKNNVELISKNYKISSLNMKSFLKENKYIFTNNVIVKNINKENKDFNLKTEEFVYNSNSGNFTGNKDIKLEVDNRKITGKKINYIKEKNEMIISNNVKIKNENNEIDTEEIIIYLNKNNSFKTKGKTKIEIDI
jgi:lipopolysaccharide assembly outer membrane protein LptD (OstA)